MLINFVRWLLASFYLYDFLSSYPCYFLASVLDVLNQLLYGVFSSFDFKDHFVLRLFFDCNIPLIVRTSIIIGLVRFIPLYVHVHFLTTAAWSSGFDALLADVWGYWSVSPGWFEFSLFLSGKDLSAAVCNTSRGVVFTANGSTAAVFSDIWLSTFKSTGII